MASITKTATLAWGYDTYWQETGVAAQGAWNKTGSRTSAIYLPFGSTLKTASITEIKMTISFSGAGYGIWDTGKLLSFYTSNYQTLDTSIAPQSYRKNAIGTIATAAYNNTVTLTLNSSTNSSLFSQMKSYFEAGNTLLCLYNGENSNVPDGYTFSDNYLKATAWSATVTYSPKYTLTVGKGTGISSVSGGGTYVEGTQVSVSATASSGYNFSKWTSGSSSSSTQLSTANPYSFKLTGNTTVYAQASLKTYTISYSANGGSGSTSAQTKTHGTNLTLRANGFTAPTGKSFKNWNTKADGTGTSYAAGASYSAEGNATLYAQWSTNSYTVTFNANGGTTPSTQTMSKAYGASLGTLPTTSRDGYKFNGWYTATSGGSKITTSTTVTGNVTYYAQWSAYTLTVIYNANGGTQGSGSSYTLPHTTTATYGTNYNGTNGLYDFTTFALTKAGQSATYWNTKADGSGVSISQTTAYTAEALATACGLNLKTGNVTINFYPQWSANSYTVTYNANGGSGSMADSTATYGAGFKTRANTFTRTGYVFTGWNEKADGSGVAWGIGSGSSGTAESGNSWTWTYTKNITLYAQWRPWTYTIKYNANGGSGTMATSSHTYGTTSNLSVNSFTRANYSFLGWATSTTGAVVYENGAIAPDNITADGDIINLYAIWSQKTPWTLSSVYIQVNGQWHIF